MVRIRSFQGFYVLISLLLTKEGEFEVNVIDPTWKVLFWEKSEHNFCYSAKLQLGKTARGITEGLASSTPTRFPLKTQLFIHFGFPSTKAGVFVIENATKFLKTFMISRCSSSYARLYLWFEIRILIL